MLVCPVPTKPAITVHVILDIQPRIKEHPVVTVSDAMQGFMLQGRTPPRHVQNAQRIMIIIQQRAAPAQTMLQNRQHRAICHPPQLLQTPKVVIHSPEHAIILNKSS